MEKREQEAVVAIALLAAFADGNKSESEHAAIRRIAEGFQIGAVDLAGLLQKVMTQQLSITKAASDLETPEAKNFAYEVALCICEANGVKHPDEVVFLKQLQSVLQTQAESRSASSLATTSAPTPEAGMAAPETALSPLADPKQELDPLLLKYSILTSALELLPQTAGALAILPVQMKMVYDIGKRHGIELDRNSIKDFGAALGIGAAGQVLETGLRRLISGVVGAMGGSTVGSLSGGAASTALTFATTFALGTVADHYYASGRKIDLETLKQNFLGLIDKAKLTQAQYTNDITVKAKELAERFRNTDLSGMLGSLLQGKF